MGALPTVRRRASFLATLAVLVFCVMSALGCHPSAPNYNYKIEPDPRGQEYRIGPLDQLAIVVWENRDMSANVTVRPDGVITLPLIGDLKAEGRTTVDLQKEIAKKLSSYMRAEEIVVSVNLMGVNSYHFSVLGQVEKPGFYTAKSYATVVEAITMAGGPNRFAGSEVFILRGSPARRIPINLRRATSSEYANENLVVLGGDVLYMP